MATARAAAFSRILSELRTATEEVTKTHSQLRHDIQTLKDLEADHRSASDRRNYGLVSGAAALVDDDESRRAEFQRRSARVHANESRHRDAVNHRISVISQLSLEISQFRESDWMFVERYLTSRGARVPESREAQLASLHDYPGVAEGLLEGLLELP